MQRYGSWGLLGLLLTATLVGALTYDRRGWHAMM